MRRNPSIAAALGLAFSLVTGASSAPVDPNAYNPYVTIDFVSGAGPGAQATGQAAIRTQDYLQQARGGRLARLELEVRDEALKAAFARAHAEGRGARLNLRAPEAELRIADLRVSGFQIISAGPDARVEVAFAPSKLALVESAGPAGRQGTSLQAERPGPVPGGRPDPGGPDQNLALPAPLADLRIRAARQDPADPQALQVRVVNGGAGAAAATQVKVFYHRSGQVVTAQGAVPALASGQDAWVKVALPGHFAGAKHLTARVDDPNVVPESNELNNGFVIVE
jgi:hypothetical protein